MDSVKGMVSAGTNDPQVEKDYQQKMFNNSTDQLPPEQIGMALNNDPKPQQQLQQQLQRPQQQKRQQQTPTTTTTTKTSDVEIVHAENQRRIHFDTLDAIKTFKHDIRTPRPSMVQLDETRNNADFFTYFDFVFKAFKAKYPNHTIPDINFQIAPLVGKPFACEVSRSDCTVSPLAIATTAPLLRKVFRVLTPRYEENSDKLGEVTDSLFFSPNRCRFVIAKALSEAALGIQTPLASIKLLFLRWFPDRYYKARVEKECRSDTMAARTDLQIALGGLEHITKLHHFYRLYKDDIPIDNDAVYAADRFLNLLEVIEDDFKIKPHEALIAALPPGAFLSDDPTNVLTAAHHIVDSENNRQARALRLSGIDDPSSGI